MSPAQEYERVRDMTGTTVEEWEAAQGLQPYKTYPALRAARSPSEDGWFMYADRAAIIAEEDRQMRCLRALGMTLKAIAALYDTHFCRVEKRTRGA